MNRFAVTIVTLFAASLWALVLAHNGWVIPPSFFAPLSAVVTATVVVLAAFNSWIWRWPVVRSLVKRPDLRGTWRGTIRSSSDAAPIEVFMVIRQTFSTLHLRLLSAESQSFSLTANVVEEAPGQDAVTWVFRNEPRLLVRSRSSIHHGGGLLRASGSSLAGHYWTDRSTSGEVKLELLTRTAVNDYDAAMRLGATGRIVGSAF
jgi:hypothetical protein